MVGSLVYFSLLGYPDLCDLLFFIFAFAFLFIKSLLLKVISGEMSRMISAFFLQPSYRIKSRMAASPFCRTTWWKRGPVSQGLKVFLGASQRFFPTQERVCVVLTPGFVHLPSLLHLAPVTCSKSHRAVAMLEICCVHYLASAFPWLCFCSLVALSFPTSHSLPHWVFN